EANAEEVAGLLVDGCRGMPTALEDALHAFVVASRASSQASLLRLLDAEPRLRETACAGYGRGVVQVEVQRMDDPHVGPADVARAVGRAGGVGGLGGAGAREWLRVKNVELVIFLHGWLLDAGFPAPRVRAYTRGLGGLDEPAPKTLAEQYPDDGLHASDR